MQPQSDGDAGQPAGVATESAVMEGPVSASHRPHRVRLTLKTVRRAMNELIDEAKDSLREAQDSLRDNFREAKDNLRLNLREAKDHLRQAVDTPMMRRLRTRLRNLRSRDSRSADGSTASEDSDGGYSTSRSDVEASFYCTVCMQRHPASDGFTLSNCGHRFCRDGIRRWVAAKVHDGSAFPTCFHVATDTGGSGTPAAPRRRFLPRRTNGGCKAVICEGDIRELLQAQLPIVSVAASAAAAAASAASSSSSSSLLRASGDAIVGGSRASQFELDVVARSAAAAADTALLRLGNTGSTAAAPVSSALSAPVSASGDGPGDLQLYERLLSSITRPTERECPACGHKQGTGSAAQPSITCANCHLAYCYFHSNAHSSGVTCAQYEAEHARSWAADRALISRTTKRCPGCSAPVEKDAGCNTMRCTRCGTGWCWLCLKPLDDGELRDHFAFWNLRGCPLKQTSGNTPGPFSDSWLLNTLYAVILIVLSPIGLAFGVASMLGYALFSSSSGGGGGERMISRVDGFASSLLLNPGWAGVAPSSQLASHVAPAAEPAPVPHPRGVVARRLDLDVLPASASSEANNTTADGGGGGVHAGRSGKGSLARAAAPSSSKSSSSSRQRFVMRKGTSTPLHVIDDDDDGEGTRGGRSSQPLRYGGSLLVRRRSSSYSSNNSRSSSNSSSSNDDYELSLRDIYGSMRQRPASSKLAPQHPRRRNRQQQHLPATLRRSGVVSGGGSSGSPHVSPFFSGAVANHAMMTRIERNEVALTCAAVTAGSASLGRSLSAANDSARGLKTSGSPSQSRRATVASEELLSLSSASTITITSSSADRRSVAVVAARPGAVAVLTTAAVVTHGSGTSSSADQLISARTLERSPPTYDSALEQEVEGETRGCLVDAAFVTPGNSEAEVEDVAALRSSAALVRSPHTRSHHAHRRLYHHHHQHHHRARRLGQGSSGNRGKYHSGSSSSSSDDMVLHEAVQNRRAGSRIGASPSSFVAMNVNGKNSPQSSSQRRRVGNTRSAAADASSEPSSARTRGLVLFPASQEESSAAAGTSDAGVSYLYFAVPLLLPLLILVFPLYIIATLLSAPAAAMAAGARALARKRRERAAEAAAAQATVVNVAVAAAPMKGNVPTS